VKKEICGAPQGAHHRTPEWAPFGRKKPFLKDVDGKKRFYPREEKRVPERTLHPGESSKGKDGKIRRSWLKRNPTNIK